MKLNLADNIRLYRKSKNMTQEQLAEALGVTVGAVSKWESGSTTPDIGMIVEIAGFFEISVDVLLGYQLESGTLQQMLERIEALNREHNFAEAIHIGEKALKKFPNNFDVVYQTALCYLNSGAGINPEQTERALQLLEHSLKLFDQNTDPEISEWLIKNQLGEAYLHQRQPEKALALYHETNFNGINNSRIAQVLADILKRYDEAAVYAKKSYRSMIEFVENTMISLASITEKTDKKRTLDCMLWLIGVLEGVRPDKGVCVSDKQLVNLYQAVCELSYVERKIDAAKEWLVKGIRLAMEYDATPPEEIVECRFFPEREPGRPYADSGAAALAMMEQRLHWQNEKEEPGYYALWKEAWAEVNGKNKEERT